MTTRRIHGRSIAIAAGLIAVIGIGAGCSGTYSAEKDGKDLGDSICDAKNASSSSERQSAIADATSQLKSIAGNYASLTDDQRGKIAEDLSALKGSIEDRDQTAINGDIAQLQQTVSSIGDGASEMTQSVTAGINEGLSGCTD